MDLHLKGKNAVILGGTRGIGRAIADTLADEGANVAICARNADQVKEAVTALNGKGVHATGAPVDITDGKALTTWIESAAKTLGSVRIMVTGHTDTMGSDKYNQALSVRRATTVKEEMVRQGLGADSVAIEGKSFHDPMVPTGPNVREPKNRRAVIDLGG